MADFKGYYCKLFETFGYPLNKQSGVPLKQLTAVEKRLGVRIPNSLRDYLMVAGRERGFNRCHNRLLPPADWFIDKGKLVFMEENQRVVFWGVSSRNLTSADPAVYQGVNNETISWYREHPKCSVFLAVMLHYQAVSGGYRHIASSQAPDHAATQLRKHWTYYGEVNGLAAFSRSNQVVCVMPPGDLPFMQKPTLMAGAKTKAEMETIANDLGVDFD